jgi:hypothetical protein
MPVRIRLFPVASSADASAPIGAFSTETPVSGWKNRRMTGTVLIQADVCAVACSRVGIFSRIRDVRLTRSGLLGRGPIAIVLEMKLKIVSLCVLTNSSAYDIPAFNLSFDVQGPGQYEVFESLAVNFKQRRRGVIRSFPTRTQTSRTRS